MDEAIDAGAAQYNLRDTIEDYRIKAETSKDPSAKASNTGKGQSSSLMLQSVAYDEVSTHYGDTSTSCFSRRISMIDLPTRRTPTLSNRSFVTDQVSHQEVFFRSRLRAVFKTLEKELIDGGLKGLAPIERMEPADGMAVSNRVSCMT